MKRLALAALFLLLGSSLMAQQNDTVLIPKPIPVKHFAAGVTFGTDRNYHIVDMSYMKEFKYDEFCSGKSYGVKFAYRPWNWLAVRVDAVLIDKDYNLSHIFQYEGASTRIITNTYTHNQYLNVPLVADLSFGRRVRLHAFGGAYYGYWLSSHRSGVSHSMNGGDADQFDEEYEFSDKRDNREEYGLVYGGGLSCIIVDFLEIDAEARWYYGVSDIQKEYQRNLNPRYNTTMVLQAGLSYRF